MQHHELKRKNANKKTKTVGRGGKRGKTSGRGTKGQNARAGRKKRPELRDLIKKIPKLRGRGKNIFKSFEKRPNIVKLSALNGFKTGAMITPAILLASGMIEKKGRMTPRVKILAGGEFNKALKFKDCEISSGARTAIMGAGGEIAP